MKSGLMHRLSRIGRPGMFGAVLVSIAIVTATSYVSKLTMELESVMDDVEQAREEFEGLETQRATVINEIDALHAHRDEMLANLRKLMEHDISQGKYDKAVNARHNTLARNQKTEATPE